MDEWKSLAQYCIKWAKQGDITTTRKNIPKVMFHIYNLFAV